MLVKSENRQEEPVNNHNCSNSRGAVDGGLIQLDQRQLIRRVGAYRRVGI